MEHLSAVESLAPRTRELAPTTETERRLPAELAQEFGRLGVWRSCVPQTVGGRQDDLMTVLQTITRLSAADGAAGWCAMIGATSGVVYAYLDPDVGRQIFSADPDVCTGGVYAPSGRAKRTDGGWRVDGRWAFCSGVDHTGWLTLGVIDGDSLQSGAPHIFAVLVPKSEAEVIDTWNVSGLRGTGSHDVALRDVFVPDERTFRFAGGAAVADGALYTFPIFGLLALGVASVAVGIAHDAIDELVRLATEKTPTGSRRRLADRSHAQMEVAKATAELAAAESFIGTDLNRVWLQADEGTPPSVTDRARLRLAATNAARASARVVDRMYDLGGGSSIYAASRLQRDFRDVHAVTQHMVVSPATYELAGRVLLGLETDVNQL
jgi:alkylation response protein AidB-like acyl-CoA dehydrogenase